MADYKELLRRAISALPENNGAARRAVYEKARSALVGQLRAITPPLPARDITQHRLQLEDCIRQVEQEASEAVIMLGRESIAPQPVRQPESTPAPAPVAPPPAPVVARPAEPPRAERLKAVETPRPVEPPKPVEAPRVEAAAPAGPMSIEDIIEQAAETSGASVETIEPAKDEPKPEPKVEPRPDIRPIPSIVARAEASKAGPTSPIPAVSGNVHPLEAPLKAPSPEPRRDPMPLAANSTAEPVRVSARIEPAMGNQAVARQQVATPLSVVEADPVETALSTVREVEVEPVVAPQPDTREAEGAIERAIETLDREARGELTAPLPDRAAEASERVAVPPFAQADGAGDSGFAEAEPPRSGGGLTIFLIVFAVLLLGAGGAGFWAWREGYVNLDQMFGQGQPAITETAEVVPAPETPAPVPDGATGPGNTATATPAEPASALDGMQVEDRLEPTPEAVVPTGGEARLPGLDTGEVKSEERLTEEGTAVAATDPAASVDPAVLAGSQSLLLEASADGRTGAVPFSGTVEWSEGVDELGLPTLIGTASIPARNLGVDVTIRKNSDPSLPASHLMEVDFQVSDTFIGGTIANLPGVLLKDQELVPGTPLVGASARVVGNSFLFALSASEADTVTNSDLLENRRWMDLAVVYGTGRNAIITLEKDDEAQALFDKVFTTWAQ